MTEKETKTEDKTQREASAQVKQQAEEQTAAQPSEETEAISNKAPEVVSVVLHKVKNGVSVAYGTGSTMVREAYHAASDYADKQKHKLKVRKLKAQREATSAKLGSFIYTRIIIDGELPEKAIADQESSSLLQQIQDLDNEVAKIGEELEKY